MKVHPDSTLIRRMLCGPIGSAEVKELCPSADDLSGDLTEATHAPSACLNAGAHAGTTAPAAVTCPPPAVGAFLDTSVHGHDQ